MFAPVDPKLPPKVLVVGAGPAGLVLALSLLQNGVPVRIIDKVSEHPVGQRGAGIQPRSMELYRTLGVLDDILREFIHVPKIRTCERGSGFSQVVSVFDSSPYMVPTPECPYLNPVLLGQSKTQGILRTHLKRLGREVELATELVDLEQNDKFATCRLKKSKDDGSVEYETLKVDYVVGADGGRGFVRKKMGFSFLGETRNGEHWVIADVRIKNFDKNYWHFWGDFQNTMLIIRPTDDGVNDEFWIAIAGPDINWKTLSKSPQHFIDEVKKLSGLRSVQVFETLTLNYYRINIRMVDTFRKGRVFLSGDTAHAHAFIGGQGMNSSIQDSFNLGWKLALVTKSSASPRLLDSYSAERLPIIANMLDVTKELLQKVVELEVHDEIPEEDSPFYRGMKLYQLDLNCRGSPVVVDRLDKESYKLGKRLRAGDRAPNAPGILPLNLGLRPGATELFDIYASNRHTALIFLKGNETVKPYLESLKRYPPDTVLPVIVLQKEDERDVGVFGETSVVRDSAGHCWRSYSTEDGAKIVVVRPDGCVGAVGRSAGVVEEYQNLVFGASEVSTSVSEPVRARL